MDRASISDFIRDERSANPGLSRFLSMLDRGVFVGDDDEEPITTAGLDHASLEMVYYLVRILGASRTIETGFGLGISAAMMLIAKHGMENQRHISIDPYGLSDGSGRVIQRFLERQFEGRFERIMERSDIALPSLIRDQPDLRFNLSLIDGDHRFDGTLIDFCYLDRLCAVGGYILVDDIDAPAIEAAVNFIRSNRADYEVTEIGKLALLRKLEESDRRGWDHFRPFTVPNRRDWALASI